MTLWAAFIKKNGLSEEEILQNLGYLTVEMKTTHLGFESAAIRLLRATNSLKKSDVYTLSTTTGYLAIVDYWHSQTNFCVENQKKSAKFFRCKNVYKFAFDNNVNIESISQIKNGKLLRLIYFSDREVDYGERIDIEPDTKKSYFLMNLFGEKEEIIVEKHNPYKIVHIIMENMLKKVLGDAFRGLYRMEEIKLDKRIVKRIEPVHINMDK